MTEVTSEMAQSIEPGTVQFGEWEIQVGRAGEETLVMYRGSKATVPDGYGPLIAGLARTVDAQAESLNELATDPDVALPEFTRDEEKAVQQVARIAVLAVIDPWTGRYGTLPYDSYADLRESLTAHFAELLGHYSRRTANLMAERQAHMLILEDARKAEWAAAQNSGYWHQRCTYAEAALQPIADAYQAISGIEGAATSMGTITMHLDDVRHAHGILAEMRKDGHPGGSYERYIRDRRQAKIFDWALRTFTTETHDAVALDERAFRMLEEALELWQSAINADLVDRHGGPTFRVTKAEDWTACANEWNAPYLDRLQRLIGRVLSGDPGEIGREYGGLMITAACLAHVTGHSLCHEEQREWTRVNSVPAETFQERHQVKIDAGI